MFNVSTHLRYRIILNQLTYIPTSRRYLPLYHYKARKKLPTKMTKP